MNRKAITIATAIALLGLSACTPIPPAIKQVFTDIAGTPGGSDPVVTECALPGEHFVAEPAPQCVPDSCLLGERWVTDRCVAD